MAELVAIRRFLSKASKKTDMWPEGVVLQVIKQLSAPAKLKDGAQMYVSLINPLKLWAKHLAKTRTLDSPEKTSRD